MMYDASSPPKMTISETMTHQTASRPVGIPAALRVVAMGLIMGPIPRFLDQLGTF
jgi:hypothetical protein